MDATDNGLPETRYYGCCVVDLYNQERPHQGLGYATPAAVYFDPGAYGAQPARWEAMQPQRTQKARPAGQPSRREQKT